ncbi:unnamed protein product [Linum tenue]|uniref:Uncharacterized protein n=1 Tax=Linum tenue TaxID=586396 RepID=A0AAV0GUA1_9ROSI|nr:unnamed protein product [Linum tenue]
MENNPMPTSMEAIPLHVPLISPQHQHPRRPVLLVHPPQSRSGLLPILHRHGLCRGSPGLHRRSGHLPESPERHPLPHPPVLGPAPLRTLWNARRGVHPAVEPLAGHPGLVVRDGRGVRVEGGLEGPVDPDDRAEHEVVPVGDRGHVLRAADVHRQLGVAVVQVGRRVDASLVWGDPNRVREPVGGGSVEEWVAVGDIGFGFSCTEPGFGG